MFTKILIPLDTSELATKVLDYLPPIVDKEQAELVLMSAIVPDTYFYATSADEPELLAQLMERIEQRFSRHLLEVKKRLTDQGYRVKIVLLYGDGAQSVVDVATREGCDLIAMTTHGRTGFRRWIMGSVADRVLQTASQPVFLARAEPSLAVPYHIENVLLPLDGSVLAEYALPIAQRVASQAEAQIKILHALSDLSMWEKQVPDEDPNLAADAKRKESTKVERYLKSVCEKLNATQIESSYEMVDGNAIEAILERAETDKIGLIVMNSHGRSGYFRWAQGSVAAKVLHETTCPILITRGLQMVDVEA